MKWNGTLAAFRIFAKIFVSIEPGVVDAGWGCCACNFDRIGQISAIFRGDWQPYRDT